jgi:protein involved in polysaccharide export with SLBB domain
LAGVGLLALSLGAMAQSPGRQSPVPTDEQLEMINQLPPAQRQAVLRELRQQQRQAGQDEALEQPELVLPPEEELAEEPEEEEEEPLTLAGESTVVLEFDFRFELLEEPPEELEAIEAFRSRLLAGNPYQLDGQGYLYLPGVPAIALAGLDMDQAVVRIEAETILAPFKVFLTPLPLAPVGVAALEPFGYDLFRGVPTTFAPATDIPVPADYVIGPGDTVNVQLFGNENAEYVLVVSREGVINFPEIGPISVAGLGFDELENEIIRRVSDQMIGVRASVTLGELRSIRVFVLGDVERPGSYTVSGLSTMTNALFVSGGVSDIGSLRRIELKRAGRTAARLDLYDLLLRGDTRGDARLQPGDVIFVPAIGATVTVSGDVKRPAIYELRDTATVAQVVELAGGYRATANPSTIKVERVDPGRGIAVRDVDVAAAANEAIRDGDLVRVLPSLEQLRGSVRLVGNVYQPGLYEWTPGMRLTDLLPAADLVKPLSDLNYVLIRREVRPNVQIEVLSADLEAAWRTPRAALDVTLVPGDTVHLFNQDIGRERIVSGLIAELRAQAAPTVPVPIAQVGGRVRAPGEYPLEAGMRISDLIRAGGGLSESAYSIDAELTRPQVVGGEYVELNVLTIDLAAILAGDSAADLIISPYDYLNIKEIPRWREQQTVELLGEVVFPGTYPIKQGERLSQVIARAGGITEAAFLAGAVFLREDLKEREREQIANLAARIEGDLASSSLAGEDAAERLSIGRSLVEQLRATKPTGRLVIDLTATLARADGADILLKDGDRLMIPDQSQEVTVLGEVQYPTSHVYADELDRDDYIFRSGGLSQKADKRRVYVVRASGEVLANSGSRFFRRAGRTTIRPGDTIVVPLDTERVKPIVFWSSATQILYNLAIAAAAVNSF